MSLESQSTNSDQADPGHLLSFGTVLIVCCDARQASGLERLGLGFFHGKIFQEVPYGTWNLKKVNRCHVNKGYVFRLLWKYLGFINDKQDSLLCDFSEPFTGTTIFSEGDRE